MTDPQTQYLSEIRPSIEAGFQWVTQEGILIEEPQRGVRYNITDIMACSNNMYGRRGGGQIIPATRRALYAAFLTAAPRFQEPVFLVQVQCPRDIVRNVYQCLSQRRGQVLSEDHL